MSEVEKQLENTAMSPVFKRTLTYFYMKNLLEKFLHSSLPQVQSLVFVIKFAIIARETIIFGFLWKFLLGKILFIFIS
jgi:hypothetical protein